MSMTVKNIFLAFSVLVFIFAGFILLLVEGERFPEFYNPHFMGLASFVSALLILLPALVFKIDSDTEQPQRLYKRRSLQNLQVIIAITLLLNGAGSLGLYQLYRIGFEYDKLLHFATPFVFTVFIARFIYYWYALRSIRAITLSALVVLIGGFLWEAGEILTDAVFGTQSFGIYGQYIVRDTVIDLVLNGVGVLLAVGILRYDKRK